LKKQFNTLCISFRLEAWLIARGG